MICGKYRNSPVFVCGIEKINYEDILKEMDALLNYYHKSKDDLFTRLAILHIIFENKIHPFYDGNGRTGRAIINLELARNGLPMIGLTYSESKRYYNVYKSDNPEQKMRDLIEELVNKKIEEEIGILKTMI